MSTNIADIRKEYTLRTLNEENVAKNPIDQFGMWFREALDATVNEPNAMHLGTLGRNNVPNGRIVLLKSCDAEGFTFFTNYHSEKGMELMAHPFASLTFFWAELERQVRVQGTISLAGAEESDVYFRSRPRPSQIGAWVSDQSKPLSGRRELEEKQQELEREFEGKSIERPPYWGGFKVSPFRVEFWQGRASRLHDRILYTLPEATQQWEISRLAP